MAPGETLLDVNIWQRSRIPVCAKIRVAAGSNLSTAIRRCPGRCGPAASNRRHMITRSCSKLVRGGRSATLLGIIDSLSGPAARPFAPVDSAVAKESVSSIWPPTVCANDQGRYRHQRRPSRYRIRHKTKGWPTAIEFDKLTENEGPRVGRLWSSSGRSVSKSIFRGNSI